jgi:iron complex transport system substrate-binding protein
MATTAAAGPRVVSLDQCADQYVLALAPRADIAGVSYRATAPDSYLRAAAAGLPRRRASLEAVLAARPQLVVREWGGDALMLRRLKARGVTVAQIDDAPDFAGVRANVRHVAAALGQVEGGEALVRRMDNELAQASGAWGGLRALYLTPGGFTAGRGTLVGAILASAGLRDAAAGPDFAPVSLERLQLEPPDGLVLGFFDPASMRATRWSIGPGGAMRRIANGRVLASLPGALLGCPGWFAADASLALARAAPRPRP